MHSFKKAVNHFVDHKPWIILTCIFFLALALRLYKLSEFPVGFHIDEAILGYTGYSILHTFKDTNGVMFPMYTEVFGDYIPTGYHFLTIFPVMLLGLTEFATRLPGVLIGSFMVVPVYFFGQALFRNKTVSILCAFFFAISPWSLILSRASSEAFVSVFFVLAGFAFILQSLRNDNVKQIVVGYIFLAASYFFYHTPRLFVPLMLTMLYVFLWKTILKKQKKYKAYLIGGFISVVLLVVILAVTFSGATARFDQISIFSSPENRLVLEEQIREDGFLGSGALEARFFHNKIINTGFAFSQNYISHLALDTLFLKSGVPPIFAIPNVGLVYIIFLPFFIFGLGRILFEKDKIIKIVYIWILVAPVVASITYDDIPNMRRASVLFPVIEMVGVYGLYQFVLLFKGRVRMFVCVLITGLFVWNFLYFQHQYYIHGYAHRSWLRNNGFAEMMKNVNAKYKEVEKVIITKTGGGYPLVLFYSQYDPALYISEGSPKDPDYKGFGKYIFVPQECPSIATKVSVQEGEHAIYVDRGNCPENKKIQNRIDISREDGSLGFRLYFK